MEKYEQNDLELMTRLLKLQEQTSPIKMSIGYVESSHHVCHGIVLHEAAPKVINTLIEEGYSCDLTPYGMRVYKL